MFLNNNIWLATAFALGLVAAAFGLLFFLAWLEPREPKTATPGRARPVARPVTHRARPARARAMVPMVRNSPSSGV